MIAIFGPQRQASGLSSLTPPLIIAHRGGSRVSPEHCMPGYRVMAQYPNVILEADVVVLGDGTQAMMHDGTVDRTTLGTGANTTYDAVMWRALRMRVSQPGGGHSYNVDPDTPPAMLEDFLREFGNKHVIVVEVKTGGAGDQMRDALLAHAITPNHVIVTAANNAALQPSRLVGYQTMYAVGPEVPATTVAALGHPWVALAVSGVNQARIDEFHALNIKVAVYTIETQYEAGLFEAMGVDAIFSDDPVWIARQSITRVTDPYFTLGHTNGSAPRRLDINDSLFYESPGKLCFRHDGHYIGQLQGWSYPLPASLELTYSVDFNEDLSGSTHIAGVFLGKTDYPFTASSVGAELLPEGYTFSVTSAGALTIGKRTGGTSSTLGTQSGTAITPGATAEFRIRVTATTLTLTRLDVATTLSVTNSDYRPVPYLQFGAVGLDCAFHTVTVATYVP